MTTINRVANAVLKSQKSSSTSAYDTSATVTRVTDDAVFVHIDGGVPETPCQKTIDCKAGDVVKIRISGGKAWITGNATAPPTDDTRAITAQNTAQKADSKAVTAGKTATDAKIIAEAINQFFWHDTNGAHVTEVTKEDWLANPSGNNILMNALGVLIRSGLIASASFGAGAITFYAADGTTEIARFAADGAIIGNQTGRRIEISDKSMKLFNEDSVENMAIDAIVTSSQEIEQVVFSSAERDDDDAGTYIWTIPLKQTPVTDSSIKFIYGDGVHEYTFTYGATGTVTYTDTWATCKLTYDGNMTFTAVATYDPAPTMAEEEEYGILLMAAKIQYIAAVTQIPTFAFGLGTTAGENGFTIGKFNDDTYNNQRAFTIGNGTGYNSKSALLYVSWDGTLAMDGDITATGKIISNSSASIGGNATILGNVSVTGNITSIGTIGLAGSIKRKTYTWNISSIGANEYKSTEVNPPSESGYTPVGIIGKGIDGTGTASALWVKCHIRSSDNKLVIGIKNDNATACTNWTATVYILYVKS
jgi:hypothetical protein